MEILFQLKVSYKKDQMDTLNMNIVIKYNGKQN